MNILHLQPEILYIIFSYLDSKFLITNVSLVCKTFSNFISGDYMWKKRINPTNLFNQIKWEEINFKRIICSADTESFRWKNNGFNMNSYKVNVESENLIYHLHIPKKRNICISVGSHDNSLKFWDLEKLTEPGITNESEIQVYVKENAHTDWISSITSYNTKLCTGSWDRVLSVWDIENGCKKIYSTNCINDVNGLYIYENMVAACIENRVNVFDLRTGSQIVETIPHGTFVFQTYLDEKYIITLSDDENILIHDRKTNKVLTNLKCDSPIVKISYDGERFLFGGDGNGLIHVWDLNNGKFELIQTFNTTSIKVGDRLTGVFHTMGSLITTTQLRNSAQLNNTTPTAKMEVFSLTFPIERWALIELDRFVSDFQYDANGILALATYSEVINIFKST